MSTYKKITTATGKEHLINEHKGFNRLFSNLCKQTGLLNNKEKYTMDYDGHIVENTKIDNAFTYKKAKDITLYYAASTNYPSTYKTGTATPRKLRPTSHYFRSISIVCSTKH